MTTKNGRNIFDFVGRGFPVPSLSSPLGQSVYLFVVSLPSLDRLQCTTRPSLRPSSCVRDLRVDQDEVVGSTQGWPVKRRALNTSLRRSNCVPLLLLSSGDTRIVDGG